MAQQFDKADGTQTATIGTEHTLSTQSSAGVYTLTVNLKNMVNGDVLELRVYSKVLTGDSQDHLLYEANFADKQGDDAAVGSSAAGEVLTITTPIVSAFECVFTLKQTVGTGRSFDWRIDQLA